MKDLRDKTLSGIKWSAVSQGLRWLLQFIISVVLARILTPKDFGLVGMIIIFTGFADQFGELGLGSAVIQKSEVTDKHLSLIFWINIVAGLILTLIFIVCAPFIALFYKESILKAYVIVLSFNFFINSFAIIPRSLLYKEIRFKQIVLVESTAILISGIIAIFMAFKGYGVWSLIVQSLIISFINSVMLCRFAKWFPCFYFNFNEIRDFIHYGLNLLGFNILNYCERNFDNLLIGKYIGSVALGIYSRAYNLMLLPLRQITSVLSRVMFPSLSVIQEDRVKVKAVYLQACRDIALISFPLMIGLLVTVKPFILTIYGQKWKEVIPILQILCLVGMEQSISTTMGWIFTSQGRTDVLFKLGIFEGVVYISAFVIGLCWGIKGIAISYALVDYLIIWYPSWVFTGRLINLSFWEAQKNLSGPFFCAAAMGIFVWIFGFFVSSYIRNSILLVTQTVLGVLIYWILIRLFNITAYREVRENIFELNILGVFGRKFLKWI